MTISINIDLTEVEQMALDKRLNRLGLDINQWATKVILTRIDGISRPQKMEQAKELFDKFQSAPDELRQRIMSIKGSGKGFER